MSMRRLLTALGLLLAAAAGSAHAQISEERFLTYEGLKPLSKTQLEAADRTVIRRLGEEKAFAFLRQLQPMSYGLAWVHAYETGLEHARYRVQVYPDPRDESRIYLDILRVNMGPYAYAEAVRAYGRNNVRNDERNKVPHRRWRLALAVGKDGQMRVRGASVATVSADKKYRCLNMPCMAQRRAGQPAPQEWQLAQLHPQPEKQYGQTRPLLTTSGVCLHGGPGRARRAGSAAMAAGKSPSDRRESLGPRGNAGRLRPRLWRWRPGGGLHLQPRRPTGEGPLREASLPAAAIELS